MAPPTIRVRGWLAVSFLESVTWTVNLKVPGVVAVPPSKAVVPSKVMPVGRVPEVMLQV